MSIGGFKGGLFGSSKKRDKDSKGPTATEDDVEKARKKAEKEAAKQSAKAAKDKFDPENPAFVKFMVLDVDDNPIERAVIRIRPAYAKKGSTWLAPASWGYWAKNKRTWRQYEYITNREGFAPSKHDYAEIGSGTLIVRVYKKNRFLFKNDYSNYRRRNPENSFHMQLGRAQRVTKVITMDREGEKAEHFEPLIVNIEEKPNTLRLEGIVK